MIYSSMAYASMAYASMAYVSMTYASMIYALMDYVIIILPWTKNHKLVLFISSLRIVQYILFQLFSILYASLKMQ